MRHGGWEEESVCINARRTRATAFPYKEGGLSEPRARLVKESVTACISQRTELTVKVFDTFHVQ